MGRAAGHRVGCGHRAGGGGGEDDHVGNQDHAAGPEHWHDDGQDCVQLLVLLHIVTVNVVTDIRTENWRILVLIENTILSLGCICQQHVYGHCLLSHVFPIIMIVCLPIPCFLFHPPCCTDAPVTNVRGNGMARCGKQWPDSGCNTPAMSKHCHNNTSHFALYFITVTKSETRIGISWCQAKEFK